MITATFMLIGDSYFGNCIVVSASYFDNDVVYDWGIGNWSGSELKC